jgi:4'-phosphopantetheinyl transferase EntD
LSGLFSTDVRVAELYGCGDPAMLLPAEAALLGRAVPKRMQEFAAGRICARRALAEFGIKDFAIERAADRQPLWPTSMVGSITHTIGFCAAVVAARATTAAIGFDSELVGGELVGGLPRGGVQPHLWPSICVAAEIDWLEALPEPQRIPAATLIFSAKEAFYKCQYPLTFEQLGFHDARVELNDWGASPGSFTIAATRPIAFAAWASRPMTGRYLFHGDYVTSGLCVAAGNQ